MTDATTTPQRGLFARIKPHLHQTFFTLMLIVFVGVLLIDSLHLKWAPQAMPLVVGLITFALLIVQFVRDQMHRRAAGTTYEDEDAVTQAVLADVKNTTSVSVVAFDDDEGVEENPRLILIFSVWAILFTLVAMFVSFRLAVPLGLLVILWHATRSWKLTVFITIGVSLVLWVAFEYFLKVPF